MSRWIIEGMKMPTAGVICSKYPQIVFNKREGRTSGCFVVESIDELPPGEGYSYIG